jgi:hypothetical protein
MQKAVYNANIKTITTQKGLFRSFKRFNLSILKTNRSIKRYFINLGLMIKKTYLSITSNLALRYSVNSLSKTYTALSISIGLAT